MKNLHEIRRKEGPSILSIKMTRLPVTVKIADDEMLNSWIDHVADMNLLTRKAFFEYVLDDKAPTRCQDITNLYEICKNQVLFPSMHDALYKHTTIMTDSLFEEPFKFVCRIQEDIHYQNCDCNRTKVYSLKKVQYCPICVREDKENSYYCGRPIVHVPHQLWGVTCCYKHGIHLVDNVNDESLTEANEEEKCVADALYRLYKAEVCATKDDLKTYIYRHRASTLLFQNDDISLNFNDRRSIIRYFAKYCDIDEFLAFCHMHQDEKMGQAIDILQANEPDTVINKVQFPFIVATCGVCKHTYFLHCEAAKKGLGCPFCIQDLSEEEKTRYLLETRFGAEYDVVEVSDNNTITICHKKCGHIHTRRNAKHLLWNEHICCPHCSRHLHEKRLMTCGAEAEIIDYHNANSISVRFEDGTVRTGCNYANFKKGSICPIPQKDLAKLRLGETRRMNCGVEAEIIVYRNSLDIDVRFEDGTVRTGCCYDSFKEGTISPIPQKDMVKIRLGETRRMNCGVEAEIIVYRSNKDIDVKFADGTVRTGCYYDSFKEGNILPLSRKDSAKARLGEIRKMNCGVEAEIITYRNSKDIDVRFVDGTVRTGCSYANFKKGNILLIPQKDLTKAHLGETRKMKCGLEAEIIDYKNNRDIDVRFADGTIRTGCDYSCFKRGGLAPIPQKAMFKMYRARLGERRKMTCGLEAEIVEYRNCDDIDIRFEDGRIREHVRYSHFQQGSVCPHDNPPVSEGNDE